MDTTGKILKPTGHALKTAASKGFSGERIVECFNSPTEVYPSRSHPGQWRVCNGDLCLVGVFEGNKFVMITLYLDRVVTPVRDDQLKTSEGRRFAKVGRGR